MNAAIKRAYIGNLAEHVINGDAKIVANRSRLFGMTRVAIIPGTAQAKLDIIGIIDCPDKPTERIRRSKRYAARARYPESSRRMIKRKRIAIWGINIITLPTPAIIPSAI